MGEWNVLILDTTGEKVVLLDDVLEKMGKHLKAIEAKDKEIEEAKAKIWEGADLLIEAGKKLIVLQTNFEKEREEKEKLEYYQQPLVEENEELIKINKKLEQEKKALDFRLEESNEAKQGFNDRIKELCGDIDDRQIKVQSLEEKVKELEADRKKCADTIGLLLAGIVKGLTLDELIEMVPPNDPDKDKEESKEALDRIREATKKGMSELKEERKGKVIHALPKDHYLLTPCCGKSPFDMPTHSHFATEPSEVTCGHIKKEPKGSVEELKKGSKCPMGGCDGSGHNVVVVGEPDRDCRQFYDCWFDKKDPKEEPKGSCPDCGHNIHEGRCAILDDGINPCMCNTEPKGSLAEATDKLGEAMRTVAQSGDSVEPKGSAAQIKERQRVRKLLEETDCDHTGIGKPMCPICDPRTISEGGPRPDPVDKGDNKNWEEKEDWSYCSKCKNKVRWFYVNDDDERYCDKCGNTDLLSKEEYLKDKEPPEPGYNPTEDMVDEEPPEVQEFTEAEENREEY